MDGTYDIDIVAVHGLGGHWKETWTNTSENRERLWLRDFLPSQLKKEANLRARVMSYGYNSEVAFSKSVSDIEDHAGALLHALDMERMSPAQKERPIIFLAHSLGGIIVKKALIIAHERSSHYGSLLTKVSGMVLFGVPHRGSDVAYWADFAAKVLNASQLGANANFVHSLQKNSKAFQNISQQFIERAADLKRIYTFYELEKLHNILVVDKDSACLGLKNEISVGISANHRYICKFSDPESEIYRPVWRAIQRLCVESTGGQASCQRKAHFHVPFERDGDFVGREEILSQINLKFETQRRVALDGIGGVGKSQIAIEYCWRFKEAHPETHVFWVHAGSVGRFDQAYKSIARRCQISGWDRPGENTLQLVYEWLSDEGNGSWLMIIDNADDKCVFSNQVQEDASQKAGSDDDALNLLSYFPQTANGLFLITSRNRDAAYRLLSSDDNIIDVPLMDTELAVSLLLKKLPESKGNLDDGFQLVELLDRLPLAITQASAYITRRRISLSDYIKFFHDNTAILLEDMGDIRRDPTMKHSVVLTWHISFNQIRKENERAAELLSLMSVLERQDIPQFLVRGELDDLSFDNAIALLLDFSLISQVESRKAFGMHRLVQIATRTWLEKHNEKGLWEGTAVTMLAQVFPSSSLEARETCASLLPHANVLAKYEYTSAEYKLQLANLLQNRSWYLHNEGKDYVAKEDAQRVLDLRLEILTREDVLVSNAMREMGLILSSLGEDLAAESMYREALEIASKFGIDDFDVQESRLKLGDFLSMQHKYEEAREILQSVPDFYENHSDTRDSRTLDVMRYLAHTLASEKKFDEAQELCQQRLDILLEVKGENHPDTIECKGFLMPYILNGLGESESAEKLSRHASELTKKLYGPDHPHTLKVSTLLQTALRLNRKYDEAETLARHVLSVSEKVLGQDHRETLVSVSELANTLRYQKNYYESENLLRQALSASERVLGKEHVDTVLYRYNLITTLETDFNKHEEAEEMLHALETQGKQEEADEIRAKIEKWKQHLRARTDA